MIEFLTFQRFVTPALLIVFYYIGAIVIPAVSWYLGRWLYDRYATKSTNSIPQLITQKYRVALYGLVVVCFFCMELCWRIMFEFLIAYFDMHDALMRISQA